MGESRHVFFPWVLPGILVSWVVVGRGHLTRAPGGRR